MKTSLILAGISLVLLAGFFVLVQEPECYGYRGKVVTRDFYSRFVRDRFKVAIFLPKGYDEAGSGRYPVIYQLDGSYYGKSTAVLAAHFSCEGVIPTRAIVVAVGYYYDGWIDKRERDFIYVGYGGANENSNQTGVGGGKNFYLFLKNELIPYIDANFRTDNRTYGRTLMGHSLGGYFTVYVVFDQFKYTDEKNNEGSHVGRDVPVFANFIAASPRIVNEMGFLMELERDVSRYYTGPFPVSIYLTSAETDETTPTKYLPLLTERFAGWRFPGFRFRGKSFKKLDHLETAVPSFKEGLRFVFSREGIYNAVQSTKLHEKNKKLKFYIFF
jgi:hypothetical protein